MPNIVEQRPLKDIGFVRLYDGSIRPSRRHGTIEADCGVTVTAEGDLVIGTPTGRSIFRVVEAGDLMPRRQ